MKKILSLILSVILTASVTVVAVSAENTVTVEGVIYEFDSESQTYTVVGADVEEFYSVYIMDSVNGYAVTKIAPNAFDGTNCCIESIPAYLTEIGELAFHGCTIMCPVYFYAENVTINSMAFFETFFEAPVYLGYIESSEQKIKLKSNAFTDTSFGGRPESLVVNGYVVENDAHAFADSIYIYNLTIYGSMNFMVGSSIKYAEYIFLKGVETIPSGVFGYREYYYDYFYLYNIYIDNSLKKIESDTFCHVNGEVNVHIDDLANWCYNVEFQDNPLTYGGKLYLDYELVTDIVLPEGGDTVSARAFEDYLYLESLTVPSHIRKISYRSFINNNSLVDIKIDEGLETIEENGLMYFSDREISLPKSLETIEFIGYLEIINMLYCYPDSAAQRYAETYGVPYTLYSMDVTSESAVIDNENMCIMTQENGAQSIEDIVNISGYTAEATPSYSKNGVELYGTGSVVNIYNNEGETEGTYTVVVTGDLDGDAVCDVLDVAMTERMANSHASADVAQIYAANGCVSDKIDVSSYQNVVNMALEV